MFTCSVIQEDTLCKDSTSDYIHAAYLILLTVRPMRLICPNQHISLRKQLGADVEQLQQNCYSTAARKHSPVYVNSK